MNRMRVGVALAVGGVLLFAVSVAGVAPWVIGDDPECPETGPHGFFLLAWPASVGLAIAGAVFLARAESRAVRIVGISQGILLPAAAVIWFVVVIADGIKECGF
jgi:hypothetical protein